MVEISSSVSSGRAVAWGVGCEGCLLQSESPVAGGVGVPLGNRHQPAVQPWPLDDVVGERRTGHDGGFSSGVFGSN